MVVKTPSPLLVLGLLAAVLIPTVSAQDTAPKPAPIPSPSPAPAAAPTLDPAATPGTPEAPATTVVETNQPPVPRLASPGGIPAPTPRQFPRPLGATNLPTRANSLPGIPSIRSAGPSTAAAPGAPGGTNAPSTIITNTVVNAEGEVTEIINFKNMPLDQFLDEYAAISRRTVLRAANLPLTAQVNFKPSTTLTPEERLQM